MSALNGWHRGERAVRKKLGLDGIPSTASLWSSIAGEVPEQHSTFHTTRLPFLPVCVLDDEGRPWGSILAGKDGRPGFVHYPRYNTFSIEAKLWEGDPFRKVGKIIQSGRESGQILVAGIGVELSTRRRNKFAGHVLSVNIVENYLSLQLRVNEALGNCPKYITPRELSPVKTAPIVVEDRPKLQFTDRLSDAAIAFVLESDTVFFGTTYAASEEESGLYPSHLGMNHRGGRPGFIRVKPSDGRTIYLPDFSGNRFMTSLGNVEATPYACLTFISFTRGDILYLTGNARNVYGSEAQAIMPLQDTLTEIFITGYTLVENALPVRQKHSDIQPSPYSPPVKRLAEEVAQTHMFLAEDQPTALLTRVTIHSPSIATFEWESSNPLRVDPGQAAIMDFRPLLGSRQYQHMSTRNPTLVNDDFIRTWTISSASPPDAEANSFSLTIREKQGGTITGLLFNMLRKLVQFKPEALEDARPLSLTVGLAGITGEFVLPKASIPKVPNLNDAVQHFVWIAGGIGVTPFLSMLSTLSNSPVPRPPYDITLVVSTNEPDVMVSLLENALGPDEPWAELAINIFTNAVSSPSESGLNISRHRGRIRPSFFAERKHLFEQANTEIYLCGPQSFEEYVLDSLSTLDVDRGSVHSEGFAY